MLKLPPYPPYVPHTPFPPKVRWPYVPYPPVEIPPYPNVCILFDTLPIGARVVVGLGSSEWVGNYGGVIDGVLFLTNAQLFSNVGNPIDGIQSVVRIPIINLQYISY
ncbi:hypothetical protein ACPUYX_03985 [Desulfosporosinus sp. SYSU MS00001]|uniref:hypothetical protein n=1 Tax=Desulfosporosinus sp. SYSU MS00001 TaxID=3416284 RepID=UPI003CEAEBD2